MHVQDEGMDGLGEWMDRWMNNWKLISGFGDLINNIFGLMQSWNQLHFYSVFSHPHIKRDMGFYLMTGQDLWGCHKTACALSHLFVNSITVTGYKTSCFKRNQ